MTFKPDPMRQGANIFDKQKKKTKVQKKKTTIEWIPQKRQLTFMKACGLSHPFNYYLHKDGEGRPKIFRRKDKPDDIKEPKATIIGYGGAAGGGKTDAILMTMFVGILTNPGAKCGFFRRKFTQLEGAGGAIMRSKELFTDFEGAKWNGTNRTWTFTSLKNGIITFNHLQNEDDIYDYQSQQFDYIGFDEATQFTRSQYRYLVSRMRATVKGTYPFMMLTTNPGGIGHVWYKNEFIDIGPAEEPHEVMIEKDPPRYEKHIFIPAYLDDNIILEDRDPRYRKNLENQSKIQRERLLKGNWDIHSGQFFPEFNRDIHCIEPFDIPDYWKRFISIDYGLDMSAIYWYALDDLGFYYCYKELYKPNLALSSLAEEIRKKTTPIERDALAYTVASPDLWNRRQETGKSGRQILVENGLSGYGLRKADNRRVEGWRVVREYIKPFDDPLADKEEENPKQVARVRFFENSVRKLPSHLPLIQADDNNPDDVAGEPHDITHAPESFRYFCMSRPPLRSMTDKEREEMMEKRKKNNKKVSRITAY